MDTPLDEAEGGKFGGEAGGTAIAQARRGDHGAFAALVTHYDDRLRALAFHLLGDPEATRDALQDAYVKAYVGLPGFRGESEIGTWLHRIVY
ncbi:MAG: sigma factor, partial [Actinomycetes bacterium]